MSNHIGAYRWSLDQLKTELSSRKEIKAWLVTQEHVRRRERYFMMDGRTLVVDQDRDVHAQNIQLKLFVHLPMEGRQGEVSKKLFPALPLGHQIDSAIEAAMQTDHQSWELPVEIPAKIPNLKTADPRMEEDLEGVTRSLTTRIREAVSKKRNTTFNSAEQFLSVHDREQHFSNGLVHRSSQSRIYVEAAFSFGRKNLRNETESDEYLNTRWSVSLDDLAIEALFDETSDRAEHSLNVAKPVTGKYPVMIDADVLATLLNGHLSQLSAGNAYNGLPFVKPGQEFIPSATGDLMTVSLDPTLDCGADTAALSEQGIVQKPLTLVQDNRVVSTITDKQYSDYLGSPTTSVRGSVVLGIGALSHEELTRAAPRVIEILQFSGLFADPNTGTFSSEVRLARLHDNVKGTVSYLKGGSLSGSIVENFKGARFSNRLVKHAHFSANSLYGQGYFGPDYALLSGVSVVG